MIILCNTNFICATEIVNQAVRTDTTATIEDDNVGEDANSGMASRSVDKSLNGAIQNEAIGQEIQSLKLQIEDLEESISSSDLSKDYVPYILFFLLAIGGGYLFYSRRLLSEYSSKTIDKLDQELYEQDKKIIEIGDMLSTVKQELGNLQNVNENLKKTVALINKYNEPIMGSDIHVVTTQEENDSSIHSSKPTVPKKSAEIVRYAMFCQGTSGDFTIPVRAINENPMGQWFEITFTEDGNCGTYTINPICKSEILNDLTSFRNYVENFNIISAPRDIQVIDPGKLVKKGNVWEISAKMIIKLS